MSRPTPEGSWLVKQTTHFLLLEDSSRYLLSQTFLSWAWNHQDLLIRPSLSLSTTSARSSSQPPHSAAFSRSQPHYTSHLHPQPLTPSLSTDLLLMILRAGNPDLPRCAAHCSPQPQSAVISRSQPLSEFLGHSALFRQSDHHSLVPLPLQLGLLW